MSRNARSLLGTVAIIVLLVVYPLAIAILFGDLMAQVPGWAAVLVFAALGLLWFVPAALVIRWMSRPD